MPRKMTQAQAEAAGWPITCLNCGLTAALHLFEWIRPETSKSMHRACPACYQDITIKGYETYHGERIGPKA